MNATRVGLLLVVVVAILASQLEAPRAEGQRGDPRSQVAIELLGRRAGLLPWEGRRDVLGLRSRALKRRFDLPNDPVETESRIRLEAPPSLRATVRIAPVTDMLPGDVRAYHIEAEIDDAIHSALRAHLAGLYGEPRAHRAWLRGRASGVAFGDARRARRIVLWNVGARGSTVVTVERFLSLPTLIGEGRPTVGLGGRNWVSGRSASFARTCARAGWWWHASDEECVLPPTEFSRRGRLVAGDGGLRLELKAIALRADFVALEAELAQALSSGFGEATADDPLPGPGRDSERRYTFASGAQLWARVRAQPDRTVHIDWVFEYAP